MLDQHKNKNNYFICNNKRAHLKKINNHIKLLNYLYKRIVSRAQVDI